MEDQFPDWEIVSKTIGEQENRITPPILFFDESDTVVPAEEKRDPLLTPVTYDRHKPHRRNGFTHSVEMQAEFKRQSDIEKIRRHKEAHFIADPMSYVGTRPDIEVRW